MQLPAAQTSLEPQPHRADPVRPRAVREPERLPTTAADSRASPTGSNVRGSQSPDSRSRVKQVAESGAAFCHENRGMRG